MEFTLNPMVCVVSINFILSNRTFREWNVELLFQKCVIFDFGGEFELFWVDFAAISRLNAAGILFAVGSSRNEAIRHEISTTFNVTPWAWTIIQLTSNTRLTLSHIRCAHSHQFNTIWIHYNASSVTIKKLFQTNNCKTTTINFKTISFTSNTLQTIFQSGENIRLK